MRHIYFVVGFLVLFCSTTLNAQAPAPPKPGPEHQKLQVFVGNWSFEGEAKPGPLGPGGKFAGSDREESLGGFFIQRSFQGKGPAGEIRGVSILGYDSSKKTYVTSNFGSDGVASTGTATVNGNTWTFNETAVVAGKPFQNRCTVAFANGNASYTVKCEASADGKSWAPTFEGKATKAR
jgi:Protein of unknown function (DUF1579)